MWIKLFNTNVELLDYHCAKDRLKPRLIKNPYVNLYVKTTSKCNAKCKFCVYRGNDDKFDVNKFVKIIEELKRSVYLRKISFTGGEPTKNILLLKELIKNVKHLSKKTFIVVSTNGYNIEELESIKEINSVALSRHHYEDNTNDDIFGTKCVGVSRLKSLKRKRIHLSCNLIKGNVDSIKEIIEYLKVAREIRSVTDVGFVSLMPVNKFTRDNFVDFDNLHVNRNKHITKYRAWKNFDKCTCSNYIYINNKGFVKFYNRHVLKCNEQNNNALLFDGKHLRHGFTKTIIT